MEKEILVTKSSLPPFEEYVKEIEDIWNTCWLTNMGPLYEKLEKGLKDYLGCKNVELYVNGHMALDVAIKAMKLTGEVITTPFTFASTTHALTLNGLTPVFCDIKADDYTIDEEQIESLITEKTSAILAVHVYGRPCNVKRLAEIAKKNNLKLIYDAAHAFGVIVDGIPIANFGDISMFSFHATKAYNTIEGGALTYKDESYTRDLKSIRNFGIEGPESVPQIGLNAKMNEFAAAMGICNLRYIDENLKKRKAVAEQYNEELKSCDGIKLIDFLSDVNISWNYAYYPILVDETKTGFTRDELFDRLRSHNIFSRKYFYPLVTDYGCYKGKYEQYNLPVASYVADRVLALPMYAELGKEDVSRICAIIKEDK